MILGRINVFVKYLKKLFYERLNFDTVIIGINLQANFPLFRVLSIHYHSDVFFI